MVFAAWLGLESAVRTSLADSIRVDTNHDYLGSALYAAAFNYDTPLASLLIDSGVNVQKREGYYGDALQLAAYKSSIKVVRLLLTAKADVRTYTLPAEYGTFGTPLGAAAAGGHKTIVQILLQRENILPSSSNSFQQSPMLFSAGNGRTGIVRLFLDSRWTYPKPTDVDHFGHTPLSVAVEGGHESVARFLLEQNHFCAGPTGVYTLFEAAVYRGYTKIALLLLNCRDNGADDGFGMPTSIGGPLKKHAEVVESFLQSEGLCLKDSLKTRLLGWAASLGLVGIAKLLLESRQTNPNCRRSNSSTPLHIAATHYHANIVKLLLQQQKTDPNYADNKGKTPLMTATEWNHVEIVRLLLEDSRTVMTGVIRMA